MGWPVLILLCLGWSLAQYAGQDALTRCIEHSSPAEIVQCVNASTPCHSAATTCLLTRITPNLYSYAAYSYYIQAMYACKRGYRMLPLMPDSGREDYAFHRKVAPMLDLLLDPAARCGVVVWMDADLVPLSVDFNPHRMLDSSAQKPDTPAQSIWLSQDASSMANTGCVVVQNSAASRAFLQQWIDCRSDPESLNDQLGFECAWRRVPDASLTVGILPAHELNSVPPAVGRQLPAHQVLHLMAEDDEFRLAVFKEMAATWHFHALRGLPLPPQTAMPRERLQEIALSIYSGLVENLERELTDVDEGMEPALVPVEDLARYRSAISKYCYLLSMQSKETESALAALDAAESLLLIREQAFHRVFSHTQSSLPEALKLAAELGFELLVHYNALVNATGCALLDGQVLGGLVAQLRDLLASLQRAVIPSQRTLVDKMVRELDDFVGELALLCAASESHSLQNP